MRFLFYSFLFLILAALVYAGVQAYQYFTYKPVEDGWSDLQKTIEQEKARNRQSYEDYVKSLEGLRCHKC